MKIDFTNAMINNDIINYESDILVIDYTTGTGRGRFTVKMWELLPAPAGKMKILIDILRRATDPGAAVDTVYNYLEKCADYIEKLRDKIPDDNNEEKKDRAQCAAEIKRYNTNIDALCKAFKLEKKTKRDVITLHKTDVITRERDAVKGEIVKSHKGYKFTKNGRVFHVYKYKSTCYIIVPCCGIACAQYAGDVKTAPEYITEKLLQQLDKIDFVPLYNAFIAAVNNATDIIINSDIKAPEKPAEPAEPEQTTPEPAQPETAPAADQETASATTAPAEPTPAPVNTEQRPAADPGPKTEPSKTAAADPIPDTPPGKTTPEKLPDYCAQTAPKIQYIQPFYTPLLFYKRTTLYNAARRANTPPRIITRAIKCHSKTTPKKRIYTRHQRAAALRAFIDTS